MHVELFQVRKKLDPLSRECRLELTPPGEWIIPATKAGSLWLTVLVKQISSHSLTSQEKLAPKRAMWGRRQSFLPFLLGVL